MDPAAGGAGAASGATAGAWARPRAEGVPPLIQEPGPGAVRLLKRLSARVGAKADARVRITWPAELRCYPHGGLPPSARLSQLMLRLQSSIVKWLISRRGGDSPADVVLVGAPSSLLMVVAEAVVAAKELHTPEEDSGIPRIFVRSWPDDEQEPEACLSLLRALERGALQGEVQLCLGQRAIVHPTRQWREQLAIRVLKAGAASLEEDGSGAINHKISGFGPRSMASYFRSVPEGCRKELVVFVSQPLENVHCHAGLMLELDHFRSNAPLLGSCIYFVMDEQSAEDFHPFLAMAPQRQLPIILQALSEQIRQVCQVLKIMTQATRIELRLRINVAGTTTPVTAESVINGEWKVEAIELDSSGSMHENEAAMSCIQALAKNRTVRSLELCSGDHGDWGIINAAVAKSVEANVNINEVMMRSQGGTFQVCSPKVLEALERNRLLPGQLEVLHEFASTTELGRNLADSFGHPSIFLYQVSQWLFHTTAYESLLRTCQRHCRDIDSRSYHPLPMRETNDTGGSSSSSSSVSPSAPVTTESSSLAVASDDSEGNSEKCGGGVVTSEEKVQNLAVRLYNDELVRVLQESKLESRQAGTSDITGTSVATELTRGPCYFFVTDAPDDDFEDERDSTAEGGAQTGQPRKPLLGVRLEISKRAGAEDVKAILATAPELDAARRRVEDAGCSVQPPWALGSWLFIPMHEAQFLTQAGPHPAEGKHYIYVLENDIEPLMEAISRAFRLRLPFKKRPEIRRPDTQSGDSSTATATAPAASSCTGSDTERELPQSSTGLRSRFRQWMDDMDEEGLQIIEAYSFLHVRDTQPQGTRLVASDPGDLDSLRGTSAMDP
mmetsp:Transcript_864/g.1946  ORF Transcript_864/g.1946 Transcript_864/m.1946 type:complete len:841 (+) Transcript_864:127-2649(+)